MGKAKKSVKTAGKAASVKPGKNPTKSKPVLRAIKGGKSRAREIAAAQIPAKLSKPVAGKRPLKPAPPSAMPKPLPLKPAPAVADDVPVIALNLEPGKLSPAMAAYFEKCEEKLGFVPNVLKAYAFDMAKLEAFVAMYNDLMLAPPGSASSSAR